MKTQIKFENLVLAQLAQRALYKEKIPSRLIKITNNGCIHALSLSSEKYEAALEILKAQGIRYLH